MAAKPFRPSEVNVDKLSFSDLKPYGKGKRSFININGREMLVVQTPEMDIPFDTGSWYESGPNSGKWPVKVSFRGMENDKKMTEFHDMLNNMDSFILEQAKKNSSKWFKKKNMSDEMLESLYQRQLKVSLDKDSGEPDGKYPPSFTFKITKYDGKTGCDCYDKNKNLMNVDDNSKEDYVNLGSEYDPENHDGVFKSGVKVKAILKCNGIWFTQTGFGVLWNATQIRINVPERFENYSFLDDSSDEENDDTDDSNTLTRQLTTAPEKKAEPQFVESSDEDDEDDEDEDDN